MKKNKILLSLLIFLSQKIFPYPTISHVDNKHYGEITFNNEYNVELFSIPGESNEKLENPIELLPGMKIKLTPLDLIDRVKFNPFFMQILKSGNIIEITGTYKLLFGQIFNYKSEITVSENTKLQINFNTCSFPSLEIIE